MARLTLEDFQRQLSDVIEAGDELVVVYSGIWTFGHRFGIPLAELPARLLEGMREILAPHQTLLLPSYTYAFAGTRVYSPESSKPETGVLPETMHARMGAVRTKSALNSFLAIGPRARELAEVRGETLWGEGSLKALFERERARMVVLGLPWETACGYLHRIEEKGAAPYRYHKTFHGVWEEGGRRTPHSETMYVRPISLRPAFRWKMVTDLLRSRGGVRRSEGEIHLESADASEIVSAGMEIIADDPYALLTNVDAVRDWVDNGRLREIAELRAAEPAALDYHDSRERNTTN